jgi:hypothetical protein
MSDPLIERDRRQTGAWWLEMVNRACVLDYGRGGETISVAAEFVTSEAQADGSARLRFQTFPVAGTVTAPPAEVRLMSIIGGASYVYLLRVIEGAKDYLVLDSVPLSVTRRRLRAFPRTPYRLGPCTAVVHTAGRQWRGLVEFHVHDVSAHGIGFTLAAGHRDRVSVGDYLRAPVTLPSGARSWIDGEVLWLTADGRGGLLTRRAPRWEQPSAPERSSSDPIDLSFALHRQHVAG